MSFPVKTINFFLLIALVISGCTGCASSYSTKKHKNGDKALQTKNYSLEYKYAVSAAVDASSRVEGWSIKDVDDEFGLVTVTDNDSLGRYVIKIYVKDLGNGEVSYDVRSFTECDVRSFNKENIRKFYDSLNYILSERKK